MVGKIFLLILSTLLTFSSTAPSSSSLSSTPRLNYSNLSVGMEVTAKAAAVVDIFSGKFLYQKNINEQLPIASLSKLMTALVFLNSRPDLSRQITIQARDEVSRPKYVYRGETVTVRDLLHLSLIGSDNNATQALIRASGSSPEDFIRQLNQQAADLGMINTHFEDVTGLSANNVSTVADLAKLGQTVFSRPEIVNISSLREYKLQVKNNNRYHYVPHTDKLYHSFLQVIAGKTGYTEEAGYCLLSLITDGKGHKILVIVLGSKEELDRFQDTKVLAWWTFKNYLWPVAPAVTAD